MRAPDPSATPSPSRLDRATGLVLVATTALAALGEWAGSAAAWIAAEAGTVLALALLAPAVGWGRRVFVAIGLALGLAALTLLPEGLGVLAEALRTSAFIAAFFTALSTLRHASSGSESVARCGRFLAEQPPGRRYAALTAGGHLFAHLLSYGSLVLLGTLAETSARREPDAEIRGHRLRRMLLAIQRGFVSTLPWSPFAFAVAITTALVPGAAWGEALATCLVSGAILILLGWVLDTAFKPRLSRPRPQREPVEGSWALLWPLAALLAVLVALVGGLHWATGIRIVYVAMPVVPAVALAWVIAEERGAALPVARRASVWAQSELPGYRGELVLLMMAGAIGTLGSALAAPAIAAGGLDLAALPAEALLIGMVWLVPLAGQLGMNPILTVSLSAPLLPAPEALGVTPAAMVTAITAGWALSGACSPFTATTLLVGRMGGVSAWTVGWRWNGVYTVTGGVLLSAWVWLAAFGGLA